MAGLLGPDYTPDPLAQGLLGLGSALLTPRQLGGGLMAGANAFNGGIQQAALLRRQMAQDALRTKLTEAQIGEIGAQQKVREAQAAEAARKAQALGSARQWVQQNKPDMLAFFDANPDDALKQLFAAPTLTELPTGDGGTRKVWLRPGETAGPQVGAAQPPKMEVMGGVARNPFQLQPGTPINDPNALMHTSPSGELITNNPLLRAKERIAAAGKTSIGVNVNTDKTYAGEVAKGLAEADVAAVTAARGAGTRIEGAQRVKEILAQNPFTGTGAPFAANIGKALATAGLIDGQRVKSTEDLVSELAAGTLDEIKTSGLGGGQGFTNTDREFLEKARAGRIDMNAASLYRLADLRERAGRAAIQRGNEVGKALRGDPKMGTVGQTLNFTEPPKKALPLPQNLTPQNLILGAEYDLGSRGKGRWNGMAFDPIKD